MKLYSISAGFAHSLDGRSLPDRARSAVFSSAVADGVIVGSALKVGGDTWAPVDPDRARDFMDRLRATRGGR